VKCCDKCKIHVAGSRSVCPLCQAVLSDEGEPSPNPFPTIPTIYRQHNLFFRWLIFASVVAAVVSVAVNLLLPQSGLWSLFVLAGIGCLWISLAIAIRKRHNIPKNMLYQVVIISGLSALWDWLTGWHGWSIDYVVPIICVCAMAALGILSRVLKWQLSDLLVYFCLDGVFGILPIVFYLTGCLHVPYPSIVCVAVSVISLAAILLFAGENMWHELKRRLHL